MHYRGAKASQISFPLGGIGTGCVGLGGNGRLCEFEIFNRPAKRGLNGYSGFAVKAERNGKTIDARMLNGPYPPPYGGEKHLNQPWGHNGFGFGPDAKTLAGLPHFDEADFDGRFPLAEVALRDARFPGRTRFAAFNPFIPLNSDDSSIPAAFFSFYIENDTAEPIDYTVCCFFSSPFPRGLARDTEASVPCAASGCRGVRMRCDHAKLPRESRGDVTLATDAKDMAFQRHWYRGGWQDAIEMFWEDFVRPGMLNDRAYPDRPPEDDAGRDTGCVEGRMRVAPGETGEMRFVIAWNFPEMYNFWNPEPEGRTYWRNYYASLFEDSGATAAYCFRAWNRLYGDTKLFADTLHGSSLPPEVIDAVSANLSVLKSPTVLRLTDGTFYGFEGCIADTGSCEGSCTHVWNYAYALPYLFPELERGMRDADFRYNQREDGRMSFRLQLPLGRPRADFISCADGQMGGVVKAYRDWKYCGDGAWLRSVWPAVKKSLDYAWAETNADRWDPGQSGVLSGRQHNTLDIELYSPSSWLNGFYLAALLAAAEMADALGEPESAAKYREMFQKGSAWTEEHLWNGEYYGQKIDVRDKSFLDGYGEMTDYYWNSEAKEIKYQVGGGCVIDQVVAGWHARLCGLPYIFDSAKQRKALQALYKHNFRRMRDVANTWRNFAVHDEEGLLICTWPNGDRPRIPLTYASECMTGFEYQAACHMIMEGLYEEGLSVVRAIRARYDGQRRNPWNEIECGSNYARSMASYSLLPALSGYTFDATRGSIGFDPATADGSYKGLWTSATGWGEVDAGPRGVTLSVLRGCVALREVRLPKGCPAARAKRNGADIACARAGGAVTFEEVTLAQGDVLTVK